MYGRLETACSDLLLCCAAASLHVSSPRGLGWGCQLGRCNALQRSVLAPGPVDATVTLCMHCAHYCRALALAPAAWHGRPRQALVSECNLSSLDTWGLPPGTVLGSFQLLVGDYCTSVGCMPFPCTTAQAKDLPIGEIIQKATLKKVLLSEQKVGRHRMLRHRPLGIMDKTIVACSVRGDVCAHLAVGTAGALPLHAGRTG